MPIGSLHEARKKKNFTLLAIIAAWIILLFVITIVKISGNS